MYRIVPVDFTIPMSFARYHPTFKKSGKYPSWVVYYNDSRPAGKKTSKTFSIKKYKTDANAYAEALKFAQKVNYFLYQGSENVEL
jgi:hypothetical protein